ncbi:MAG TPA: hypothetical protein VHH34_16945 [Pseudonocardiaceae bacterium]|nr:hypothetical protein [Pseudonocardiaceae bacterium]
MQITLGGHAPETDAADDWVAPGAFLFGDVVLDARSGVRCGAVLRGDGDGIRIGARSDIHDGAVVHTDPGHPASVGSDASRGSRCAASAATAPWRRRDPFPVPDSSAVAACQRSRTEGPRS